MKVGIAGVGTVGGALKTFFQHCMKKEESFWKTSVESQFWNNFELLLHDPDKGYNNEKYIKECDYVFICVPVLTDNSNRLQRTENIVSILKLMQPGATAVIRSTVLPCTTDLLNGVHSANVIHMPEFLTESRALNDIFALDVICGGEDDPNIRMMFPGKKHVFTSNIEAELCKYMHNCLGAVKVTYANVFYDLCKRYGANYDIVKRLINITGFFSPMHLDVPGHHGLGYSGKCFPENMESLSLITDSELIHGAIKDNNKFRAMSK